MSKNLKVAHAPYNFVPFPETVIKRYNSFDELPSHNASKKGEEELLSGEITFDIVAKTPILVADGKEGDDDNAPRTFVKNADGKYVIPGSTLRGLMRSTMSVLSLSNWTEQIDDETFFYRTVGESSSSLAKDYRNILGIGVEGSQGKQYSVVRNVKAGYIVKKGKDNYVIYPARTDGGRRRKSYYKFHEDHVHIHFQRQFKRKLREGFKVEDCRFAVNRHGKAVYLNGKNAPFKGKLLFSGPMFGPNKKKTAYIINEIDRQAKPIPISADQLQLYKSDLEFRKSKFENNWKGKIKKEFFSLPAKTGFSEAKPCFYIHLGDKLYFGFTAFLRLNYENSTKDLLPDHLKSNALELDYVKSMFGFTDTTGEEKQNYASRLSFLPSKSIEKTHVPEQRRVTLRSPRASAVTMYLKQNLNTNDYKSYNEKDARLRGMKQYWIRKVAVNQNDDGKNKLEVLPEGSTFRANIKFDQLHEDELGLLLWALQATDYHQIGMGKPYGYGSIQFKNIKCNASNNEQKYTHLSSFFDDIYENIEFKTYIDIYHQYVKSHFDIDLLDQESIKVFLNMKTMEPISVDKMNYMDVRGGYSKKLKLPTAEELMNIKED